MVPKAERLAEFLRRLRNLPTAGDAAEAREQIERTLNAVEDELTSIPFDPSQWQSDGRLYPPQDDNMIATDNAFVVCFRSVRHRTYIGVNGSIEIKEGTGSLVFSKSGADGRSISDL